MINRLFLLTKSLILFIFCLLTIPINCLAQEKTITITAVGDIMPGTNFPDQSFLPADSGNGLFTPVKQYFENSDIVFGNLEGVFLNSGGKVKKCDDMSKCYAFRMPESSIFLLKDAGFNLLNLANNHIGDFGDTAKKITVEILKKADIEFAGLNKYPFCIFTKNNIKYGFLGVSPFTGTPDITKPDTLLKIIKYLDSECDIVIVSMHAGAEGNNFRHITKKTEIFYDEDRGNPYNFAHNAIDAGADIILGHGPHVTRAVEIYKKRFIAYSLGNFCTYARFNLKNFNGFAPIIKITLNQKGEFLSGKIISIKQEGEGGPLPDENNNALKQIIELTGSDLPEFKLLINESGEIKN